MMRPGLLVLLGSGETSTVGRQVFDTLARVTQSPFSISILETPAGFELNSAQVAGRIRDFLAQHLQAYRPKIEVIPARKRGTAFSPDSAAIIAPLLSSGIIFMGPGSPTYAVRQLKSSLAWDTLRARHRMGATLVLASAAAIASGKYALPVYEIYKVGQDPFWQDGLDLLGFLGLPLVVVPHWNNTEGGPELDTRRCFMGTERFKIMEAQLPDGLTVLGIDENTALLFNFEEQVCQVIGRESVTIIKAGEEISFKHKESFPFTCLGNFSWADPSEGIPADVWEKVNAAFREKRMVTERPIEVPERVLTLVSQRQKARMESNWKKADQLRREVQTLGWNVIDTPQGPVVQSKNNAY